MADLQWLDGENVMPNPIQKWMRTRGTPIYGNPEVFSFCSIGSIHNVCCQVINWSICFLKSSHFVPLEVFKAPCMEILILFIKSDCSIEPRRSIRSITLDPHLCQMTTKELSETPQTKMVI